VIEVRVDTAKDEEGVTVALVGELDISTAPEVERQLARVEQGRPTLLALDLRELSFIDSTGLRLVLAADGRARKEGRDFVVIPGPQSVHRVFRIALLDRRLQFLEPPEQAGDE
jgi:anti-anti-sigma factor